MSDPLRTAGLREAAIAAWTQHPVRFREDANGEEDHARGYYRDRVVIELAQNAADAAARGGVPGRLLLRLTTGADGPVLVAANTGAPVDAAGVASLASLRASAKRDMVGTAPVGRFGVGFAAVRSVADEVSLVSAAGAVHFSLASTRELLAGAGAAVPDLTAEVERRGVWLPVLRLPLPGAAPAHEWVDADREVGGWATVVVLTLRDANAVDQVRSQLAAVDDVLLLALPALTEVTIQDDDASRVLSDVADRWIVAARSGVLDPALLADRPVEERDRTGWQVSWAVRRAGATRPTTVHAPTLTDEPCTVPARLIGTFPLDPSRRHVASGPLTDALVTEAGRVWSDLLIMCRDADEAPDLVALMPAGLPAGALDASVRDAVIAATRAADVLDRAAGGPSIAPADALVVSDPIDPAAVRLLGRRWPALVDLDPTHRHLVRLLDIQTAELGDVVAGLPAGTPAQVRELYDVFAGADPTTLEHLAMAPVPLVDGRTVHGARGLVVLEAPVDTAVLDALSDWGLRMVHPEAAHPLLERLGAQRVTVGGLLHLPVVRERVLDPGDDEAVVAETVLSLVGAALAVGPVEPEPWWGELLLPAMDGDLVPAQGLVLAGSVAQSCLDPRVLPMIDGGVQERWGDEVLSAVGVRTGLAVRRVPFDLEDADELGEWLEGWVPYRKDIGPTAGVGPDDVVVVADLDAVLSDAWPQVVATLAKGEHRLALAPVRVLALDGAFRAVPSYTTWWLRHRAPLGLELPFALGQRRSGRVWLGPVPDVVSDLDAEVQRWLGGVAKPDDLDGADWAGLVGTLREGDDVTLAAAVHVWRALARLSARGELGQLADAGLLPALTSGGVQAVSTDDVAVASPMWAQHAACFPVIVVPPHAVDVVATAMDLDRADERAVGRVTSHGERDATPDAILAVFAQAPVAWMEHEELEVDGSPVQWWVDDTVHAATTAGLARGLAEAIDPRQVGRIDRLLADPDAVNDVLLDLAGDDVDD